MKIQGPFLKLVLAWRLGREMGLESYNLFPDLPVGILRRSLVLQIRANDSR